jgi:hypothetical protein
VRLIENICGAKTAAGTQCQRPAIRGGNRCAHHVNKKDDEDEEDEIEDQEEEELDEESGEEEVDDTLCVHCHDENPPKETAKKYPAIPSGILLQCFTCKSFHHAVCIDLEDPVLITKIQNYEWNCSNCKICQVCSESGNDEKLLFCDLCDRAYHTFCLNPPLKALPEGSWLCNLCAECTSCHKKQDRKPGAKEVQWKHVLLPSEDRNSKGLGTYLCTYCVDCDKNFQADRFCPICLGGYEADSDDVPMASCDKCDR